jgi:hypothetical protein
MPSLKEIDLTDSSPRMIQEKAREARAAFDKHFDTLEQDCSTFARQPFINPHMSPTPTTLLEESPESVTDRGIAAGYLDALNYVNDDYEKLLYLQKYADSTTQRNIKAATFL